MPKMLWTAAWGCLRWEKLMQAAILCWLNIGSLLALWRRWNNSSSNCFMHPQNREQYGTLQSWWIQRKCKVINCSILGRSLHCTIQHSNDSASYCEAVKPRLSVNCGIMAILALAQHQCKTLILRNLQFVLQQKWWLMWREAGWQCCEVAVLSRADRWWNQSFAPLWIGGLCDSQIYSKYKV